MQRLIWLKLAATLSSLILGGCMAPVHSEVIDETEDVIVPPEAEAGNDVSFSMDADQFAMMAKWLGHENTLTIEKAVHVEQDNATLDAKAGTRFSYTMSDESGRFTFEKPYPTVKAGIAKLIGGVSLHQVDINADGSGVAATGLGKYRFRWLEDEESGAAAAPQDLPELWYWSHEGCPPCQRFEREYAENKDAAGFKPVKQTTQRPSWMPDSDPQFWWHTSGKTPSQSDISNTRHLNGYQGWKDLLIRFNNSRSPKKFERSSSAATRPFVQPDHNRYRASWTHPGHTKSELIHHLLADGIHRGRHSRQQLEAMDYSELERLHDTDHNGSRAGSLANSVSGKSHGRFLWWSY